MGAEQNHLWPRNRYQPPSCQYASVLLVRRSEPPCFSVMAMPSVRPFLTSGGMKRASYSRDNTLPSQVSDNSGERLSTGTAA